MILNKAILILLLFGIINNLSASAIRWHGDYEKALIMAKKQNKPMMLILRKKNCEDCQKMFEITFRNQQYIKQLNENFVAVIATYEDENSYPIELFYTLDFPALFFVSQKDESFLIDPVFGYIPPDKLTNIVKLLTNRD
ncbi:MAG: thioredoxin family protein [Arcobacteraceae bacterium]|nr:thioredoxin family protein [Arcobacteraceae bacterium]